MVLGFKAQQTKANRNNICGTRSGSLTMVKVGIKHRSQWYDRKRMGLESGRPEFESQFCQLLTV